MLQLPAIWTRWSPVLAVKEVLLVRRSPRLDCPRPELKQCANCKARGHLGPLEFRLLTGRDPNTGNEDAGAIVDPENARTETRGQSTGSRQNN